MAKLPQVFPVACHTQQVGSGTTFVVIKGQHDDGVAYIDEALKLGATKIVVEYDTHISEELKAQISVAGASLERVKNARSALATMSAHAAGYPANQLKLIGVTGTKGKTTTTQMIYNLLRLAGHKVAVIGSVGNKIDAHSFPFVLTTPQPDYLHQFFALCVKEHIEYVVIEVAAQAVTFNRIETLEFDGLIFTNLDREHGELYPTIEEYFATKYKVFGHLKDHASIFVNADDAYGKLILEKHPEFHSYSAADAQGFEAPQFPGLFNRYNLASAVKMCQALGVNKSTLKKLTPTLPQVPGRLEEHVLDNGARAYIDYAHTPASFKSIFETVRPWTDHLIVIFGAGGGKDHSKRPLMGQLAATYADMVIITTDNPRKEDPQAIISDIVVGISQELMHKVICEPDRELAIYKARKMANSSTVILLLGKGPDEYQIIGETKIPFSERAFLQKSL